MKCQKLETTPGNLIFKWIKEDGETVYGFFTKGLEYLSPASAETWDKIASKETGDIPIEDWDDLFPAMVETATMMCAYASYGKNIFYCFGVEKTGSKKRYTKRKVWHGESASRRIWSVADKNILDSLKTLACRSEEGEKNDYLIHQFGLDVEGRITWIAYDSLKEGCQGWTEGDDMYTAAVFGI